jgi:hypothetical protein
MVEPFFSAQFFDQLKSTAGHRHTMHKAENLWLAELCSTFFDAFKTKNNMLVGIIIPN